MAKDMNGAEGGSDGALASRLLVEEEDWAIPCILYPSRESLQSQWLRRAVRYLTTVSRGAP